MSHSHWHNFAEALHTCRTDAGISPQELARRANVGVDSIYAWENETRHPRSHNVTALAKALGLEGETYEAFMQFARRSRPSAKASAPESEVLDVEIAVTEDASSETTTKRTQSFKEARPETKPPSLISGMLLTIAPFGVLLSLVGRFLYRRLLQRPTFLRFSKQLLTVFIMLLSGTIVGILGYRAYESHYISPVTMTVAGEVVCPPDEPVVGIYIRPYDGHGQFVTFGEVSGKPNVATFSNGFDRDVEAYVLSVGCGGTAQHWAHGDMLAPTLTSAGLVQITCVDAPSIVGQYGTLTGTCTVKPFSPLS